MAKTTRGSPPAWTDEQRDRSVCMADAWAVQIDLPARARDISNWPDAGDRQAGIAALVKRAFIDGIWRGLQEHPDA